MSGPPLFLWQCGKRWSVGTGLLQVQSLHLLPWIVYFWPSVSSSDRMPLTLQNHHWLKWMPCLHMCRLLPLSSKHSALSASTWHTVAECLFPRHSMWASLHSSSAFHRFSTMFSCLAGGKPRKVVSLRTKGCHVAIHRSLAVPCLEVLTFGPLLLRAGYSLSFKGSIRKTFLHAQSCGLFGFSAPIGDLP